MKKVMLIVNPISGRCGLKNHLQGIIKVFNNAGWVVTVFTTTKRGDATRFIDEHYADFDITVCSGGDGTLHECVEGLMNQELPMKLGYIPVGTSNDFASTMHISMNPIEAAKQITKLHEVPHDIGSMNGKYFTYVAAFGTYSDISYITPQFTKKRLGKLAYLIEAVRHIPDIKPRRAKFVLDGKEMEHDIVCAVVMNSRSFGGMFKISEDDYKVDDGIFELMLLKPPKNPAKVAHMLNQLIQKKYEKHDIQLYHAKEIKVYCDPNTPWCLDGESGGLYQEVEIKVCDRQLIMYCGE